MGSFSPAQSGNRQFQRETWWSHRLPRGESSAQFPWRECNSIPLGVELPRPPSRTTGDAVNGRAWVKMQRERANIYAVPRARQA